MDGLASGSDMMACLHCGQDVRRGMVRCRECGKTILDVPGEPDFALTGHELVLREEPACPLCGAVLDQGSTDCQACTAALLDQLLNGHDRGAPIPGARLPSSGDSHVGSGLRVRRNAPHAGARAGTGCQSTATGPAHHSGPDSRGLASKARGTVVARPRAKQTPSQFATPTGSAATPGERLSDAGLPPALEQVLTETVESDTGDADTVVETSAACTALLASLATADVPLRCEIANALGRLGDKQAMGPLERHMVDQDIRVRRAVAAALVQLGHPKGQALLDIAERKPAKEVLAAAKAAPSKPRVSSGGGLDGGTVKLVAIAALAVAVVGGGVWYWRGSSSTPSKSKKSKSAATKRATAPPKKVRKAVD